jgi:hypothetical protein
VRLKKRIKKKIRRTRDRFDPRPVAHFLHIGKTAGTALRFTLHDVRKDTAYRMVLHGHRFRLELVPVGDKFFFCVRDPIDRYVSGFLSRQGRDRPRFDIPWSEQEAEAFTRFDSPEDLAVSLGAGGDLQRDAENAMRSIQHVRASYWNWFRDPEYFQSRLGDLLWIGRLESLDIGPLTAALGVDGLAMPQDSVAANRSPTSKRELSDLARENLKRWYAKDYEFLELCNEVFPPQT